MGFVIGILWVLIVLVMLVLMGIILLQEGKGGGLAEAFGGVGAETFGVKTGGIDRLTGILGAVFLVLVVAVNLCIRSNQDEAVLDDAPVVQAPAGAPVPGDGDLPAGE